MGQNHINIALVGNPNSGKTSLFNALTGLNQKVGNFPGVTVDKKMGTTYLNEKEMVNIIDLPGTYSLYPKRADEWVSYKVLLQEDPTVRPDLLLVVADASNLKRNLLFCSEIIDLKIPVVIALTMMDLANKNGTKIDIPGLERSLGVPIVSINPRKNKGLTALKKTLSYSIEHLNSNAARDFIDTEKLAPQAIAAVKEIYPDISNYHAIQYLMNHDNFKLDAEMHKKLEHIKSTHQFNTTKTQAEEILQRYKKIKQVMDQSVVEADPLQKTLFTEKLDDILMHRRWGYLILLTVLFILFQFVYLVAQYPMSGIEWIFSQISGFTMSLLPESWFSDLLVNGIIAGLGGIAIFVPQIMILFGLITILEDTGYMARISFLTDKLMRKVGLNGKSVMPMISGFACAVPAIMSARSIENKKERLLTIMITPLMSCSARLPVYVILIGLVIPSELFLGFISLQGLVMMILYLLGTVLALLVAWVMKWFIKSTERSIFVMELPVYRSPRWKNILITMVEKAKIFVVEAGKIIMVISVLLWAMSSYGPKDKMHAVTETFDARLAAAAPGEEEQIENERRTALLENSYAGVLGKAIEPVIRPLGYDWKIGIALLTSFAAREVFVGTMATLYSVGEDADENSLTLREKMQEASFSDGRKVYSLATGISLMVFYVIAMQCMSTLAIVKRETKSWKWPIIQFVYLTALAYLMSFLAYRIFL